MARFAVIGLGRFGMSLATHLAAGGAEVVAIDSDRRVVEAIKDEVTMAVTLDATDEHALRSLNLEKVDAAIVCIGESFEANQLATLLLKNIGVKKVIAKATNATQRHILQLIGADQVISPEEEMGARLAKHLLVPYALDMIPLAEGFSLMEIKAPPAFVGKALQTLKLRQRYGINVIAIKRHYPPESEGTAPALASIDNLPSPTTVIEEHDILIVIGPEEGLRQLGESSGSWNKT
jgi:trk system potassium uptake protein TrkA